MNDTDSAGEGHEPNVLRKFNEEAAYSLSLIINKLDDEENVRLAKRMIQLSEHDYKGIAALVLVFLKEEPALNNEEIAAKVLRELANSHPNRFINQAAFEKPVVQRLISACKKSNDTTFQSIKRFEMQGIYVVNVELTI